MSLLTRFPEELKHHKFSPGDWFIYRQYTFLVTNGEREGKIKVSLLHKEDYKFKRNSINDVNARSIWVKADDVRQDSVSALDMLILLYGEP